MIVTKHVQRQIAVAAVVPVEESTLLLTVKWIVSRIEIEDDSLPRPSVRVQKGIDKEAIHSIRPAHDLVVSVGRLRVGGCKLEPIERALARQREALISLAHPLRSSRIGLANQRRQQCVSPKLVVVIDVLVAERYPIHPLRNQIENAVLDELGGPVVDKTIRKLPEDPRTLLDLSKQKTTGVGGDPTSSEISHYLAIAKALKLKLLGNTLCMQESGSFLRCNCL